MSTINVSTRRLTYTYSAFCCYLSVFFFFEIKKFIRNNISVKKKTIICGVVVVLLNQSINWNKQEFRKMKKSNNDKKKTRTLSILFVLFRFVRFVEKIKRWMNECILHSANRNKHESLNERRDSFFFTSIVTRNVIKFETRKKWIYHNFTTHWMVTCFLVAFFSTI